MGTDSAYKAFSYRNATLGSYANIDRALIANLARSHGVDIAFVTPITYISGDMVQALFGKVSAIIAQNTNQHSLGAQNDVYGYSTVTTPDDYEEIYVPTKSGTTDWILSSDEYKDLSQVFEEIR